MPSRPPRACPRCHGLIEGRRCSTCHPAWHRSTPQPRNGSTRAGRKQRALLLADHPICQWPDCSALSAEDDHIVPVAEGGDLHDPANRQALCIPHHREKSALEAKRGRDRAKGCAGDPPPF